MDANWTQEFGQNAGYVEELFRLYQTDPQLVGENWARYFSKFSPAVAANGHNGRHSEPYINGHYSSPHAQPVTAEALSLQERVTNLISAFRQWGHFLANVNPLTQGVPELPVPRELTPEVLRFSSSELSSQVRVGGFAGRESSTLEALLSDIRESYCGTLGFEVAHLVDSEEREWFFTQIENRVSKRGWFQAEEKRRIFEKLFQAEALESELHKKYVGTKRFSLQGGDALLPMLDLLLTTGKISGIDEVVIGMAHRGRLGVLVNIAGKPLADLFAEFEDTATSSVIGAGDVKYHQGVSTDVLTASGETIGVSVVPNPSHLEFVNPVVAGIVRARQDARKNSAPVLGVLIHGDAAFIGQGVVAESLAFSGTKAYGTSGLVHVIINNQVGFTTDAVEARSTDYCSDMAKIAGLPIIHLNSDDVEACCFAMQLALEFRNRFQKDIVLDLYCYRKYGHNEGDDPTFTQPLMYSELKEKRTPYQLYAEQLEAEGVLGGDERSHIERAYVQQFENAKKDQELKIPGPACAIHGSLQGEPSSTTVKKDTLKKIASQLVAFPQSFSPHPKLKTILEKRAHTLEEGKGIDWGLAESLAFGALLSEGISIRLSGQDVGRGTFSHRHLQLHDVQKAERWLPLKEWAAGEGTGAEFHIFNSILSETGVMGFEFGYASVRPDTLVLWEAQFGDFANGAQVIIDQFLAASECKWGQRSGLVLLLPHGYEGQGPEHSSARLERFLQLAAEGNMTVAYPSNAAQYFHLLRRQALRVVKRPLIVMTPKSLLRSADATCTLDELSAGSFQPLIVSGKEKAETAVLLSGKVYYDVVRALEKEKLAQKVAIARLEQLYPLPEQEIEKFLSRTGAKKLLWVQEEPMNMGGWSYAALNFQRVWKKSLEYVGRPATASTACGSGSRHTTELQSFLGELIKKIS